MNVAICEYGAGNVRSVRLAFARLGATETEDVAAADLAVLPGVGSARAAMTGLRERGHDEALRERFAAGRPILGICLGLQLALDETEEDGGVAGLGLVEGRALRLRDGRVPRIGWARVDDGDAFYFAHSYAADDAARGGVVGGRRRGGAVRLVRRLPVPSGEERCGRRRVPGVGVPLPRLIPCLDVADGRVVKGVRFQGLRDVGDPVELGALYSDEGADELVFLDVTRDARRPANARRARRARLGATCASRSPSAAVCAPSPTRASCSTRAPTRWPSTRRRSSVPS